MSEALRQIKEHLPKLVSFAQHAAWQANYERERARALGLELSELGLLDTGKVERETLLTLACSMTVAITELDARLSHLETDGK